LHNVRKEHEECIYLVRTCSCSKQSTNFKLTVLLKLHYVALGVKS